MRHGGRVSQKSMPRGGTGISYLTVIWLRSYLGAKVRFAQFDAQVSGFIRCSYLGLHKCTTSKGRLLLRIQLINACRYKFRHSSNSLYENIYPCSQPSTSISSRNLRTSLFAILRFCLLFMRAHFLSISPVPPYNGISKCLIVRCFLGSNTKTNTALSLQTLNVSNEGSRAVFSSLGGSPNLVWTTHRAVFYHKVFFVH